MPNAVTLKTSILAHQTSAEEAGSIAQEAGVKTLVLSHFVPPDDPEIAEQMWAEAARTHFRGTVIGPFGGLTEHYVNCSYARYPSRQVCSAAVAECLYQGVQLIAAFLGRFGRLLPARPAGLQRLVLWGGIWLVLADVSSRVINFAKMGILARLLTPKDFGLIGVAGLVIAWFDYFSQTGFSAALVRKQDDIHPYLDTLWTVQILRGVLLSIGIFLSAPLVAWMFHNPDLVWVLRTCAPGPILRNLANPGTVYFRKQLKIEREFLLRIGGAAAGLIVGVPLAWHYRNAMALVLASLAGNAAEMVLSYMVLSFRPRFELHWEKVREMTRFGKWVFWSNVVSYFNSTADTWVVGRFFGTSSVGYYQFGQQLGSMPLEQIGAHIWAVTFPAFSSRLDRAGALRAGFLQAVRFVSTAILPLGALIVVFAPVCVGVVLGERWMPVSPLLRALAVSGAITTVGAVAKAFLLATDRPRYLMFGLFLKVFTFGVLVGPLMQRAGLTGVALAMMLATPVSSGFLYFQAVRALGWGWDLVLVFRTCAAACLPSVAAALLLPFSHSRWSIVGIAVLCGVIHALILVRHLRTILRG